MNWETAYGRQLAPYFAEKQLITKDADSLKDLLFYAKNITLIQK
jgi:hypothetical protein